MSELVKKWYVLKAISGKENKAKEYILNEISKLGLQEYVSQVLVPTEKFIHLAGVTFSETSTPVLISESALA